MRGMPTTVAGPGQTRATAQTNLAYLLPTCLVATLGGLLFGYDTGVISGAIDFLTAHFQLNAVMTGWASGCVLIGCATGVVLAGPISDRFGRKRALMMAAGLFLASGIGTALPRDIWTFIVFRFLGGIGIGIASISTPMYIAEIAPAHLRGRLVSINQIAIVGGILTVYFVNYFIARCGDQAWNEANGWRWMFATGIAPSLVFGLLLFPIAESPRWLIENQREDEARAILGRVGGTGFAEAEFSRIRAANPLLGRTPILNALFSFSGRIGRGTFWELVLVNWAISAVVGFVALKRDVTLGGLLWVLGLLLVAWIGLAIQIKRWHDRGKSGWMFLINFIPLIGWIWAFVELGFMQGTQGSNRFGDQPNEAGTLGDLFKPGMRRALVVGLALAVLQQVTGINVFLYFGTTIFKNMSASTGVDAGMLQQIVIGGASALSTIVAIATVDKWGRKPLMFFGAAGMVAGLLAMGAMAQTARDPNAVGQWMLFFIILYVVCFGLSVGPVTWVILSEIYPTAIRGRALGLATFFLWMADYAVTQTFPMLDAKDSWFVQQFHHAFPFYVYGAFCVVLVVVLWRWVPETKGKSLEEIEGGWVRSQNT
jgi:MFS family permease